MKMLLAANLKKKISEQIDSYYKKENHFQTYSYPYYWLTFVYLSEPCFRIDSSMSPLMSLSSEISKKRPVPVGNIDDLEALTNKKNKQSRRDSKSKNKMTPSTGSTDDKPITINVTQSESIKDKIDILREAKVALANEGPEVLAEIEKKIKDYFLEFVKNV